MPFQSIPSKVDFPAQEQEVLEFWKQERAFEKVIARRKGQPRWSFIDGPITANNPMGVHNGWGRAYKDLMLRFRSMQGHELRYQNGFDCQGQWVEVNVERELGFKSKKDIESYGIAKFVLKCKERVLRYAAVQTEQSIRLGYWMDWNDPQQLRWLADQLRDDPSQVITAPGVDGAVTDTVEGIVGRLGMPELGGSYFTFSNENNYMIWAFLKKCWQNGWLYKGLDVMPWCPRCATGISQHEIVTDGYKELTHPSVTLKFPLRDRQGALLIWTTTPWTLTSNVAAAVGPGLTYLKVRQGEEVFYLSKGTAHLLRGAYEILQELQGAEMEGWIYSGPFDDLPAAQASEQGKASAAEAHRVILWEAVGETEGTGIVHIAPGCGAEDFQLGKEHRLPLIAPLDEEGFFLDGFAWLTGRNVAEAAEPIFADLQRKGLLYSIEPYTHRYPVCWRCDTELVFRLVDEWFIRMGEVYAKPRQSLTAKEKARSLRYQIMDIVDQIKWIPDFGHARELDWLYNMRDWMISKKRYWGLALPIWECSSCGRFEVIGDDEELKSRAANGEGWEVFAGHTPHRPYLDAIKFPCSHCGAKMERVADVGTPWLDAGVVPFSTLRYRAERAYWRQWYPAHWISESFPGQFRNWFYSLLVMATVLENTPPFLENFGYATLLAEDGRPMHKSWGNMIEFHEAADRMGVDVMRWFYFDHKPENDLLFGYTGGDKVRRQFLIPLWNVYSFFVTYANLDGWQPSFALSEGCPEGPAPQSDNWLDCWILSRLSQVTERVTYGLEASDPMAATQAVNELIDDLTNWYVRRSRRRFWKSEHDKDKHIAYSTLYHVLVRLARLLAPFTPFLSEAMYQNLVRSVWSQALPSVHLTDWPLSTKESGTSVEDSLLEQMALVRRVASLGLSARADANLKVRQPLAKLLVYLKPGLPGTLGAASESLPPALQEMILDELNVKALKFVEQLNELVMYRILPDNKLLGPKFGTRFPKVRAALALADPTLVAARVQEQLPVALEVDGETIELAASEILVHTQPAAGLIVAEDKKAILALDATLTPELRAEGLAREVVRRVQEMRKKAGFDIENRIVTYYCAAGEASALHEFAEVMVNWGDYIKAETLSVELTAGEPPSEAYTETHSLENQAVILGVRRYQVQRR